MHPDIALDGQLLCGTPTGIGEYLHGLIAALRAQGLSFDVLSESRCDPWRFDRRVWWDQVLLPARARRYRLLHATAGTMPLLPRSGATVVTVHDVAWLRVQEHARWYARHYFGERMLGAYRRAAAIITDSYFSRDELVSFPGIDPQSVHVVYPGVAEEYAQVIRNVDVIVQAEQPLILAVGTVEARKNLAVVIRALAALENRQAVLVSCGPPTPYLAECQALAASLGVAERVQFRGYISREHLLELYAQAAVAVVPSRYEGFGLGAAQAVVAGVPLLVADTSALPEVAGDGAQILAVDDVAAWSAALDTILANPAQAIAGAQSGREAAYRRFSWAEAAARTAAVYRTVLE